MGAQVQHIMAITVKQALTIGGLQQGQLLTGEQRLDKIINHVNILEAPWEPFWQIQDQLLLTSFYALQDDVPLQVKNIKALAENGCAALVFQTGVLDALDPQVVQQADLSGLPLIEVDESVSYHEIITPLISAITREKTYLLQRSQEAETVRLTTALGTDMRMTVDKAGDHFWEDPPAEGGFPQMLGGQSGFMAHRESYEGTLVFDAAIWPPSELGLLREPVKLTLEEGFIQKIEGGPDALFFERWLAGFDHPESYRMDHACYGFNPGVPSATGRILEDERVFGCMQFGIGATEYGSPSHTDGVVLNPSVWLDDMQIEENGRYIHPDLIEFCRRMGAPGY